MNEMFEWIFLLAFGLFFLWLCKELAFHNGGHPSIELPDELCETFGFDRPEKTNPPHGVVG